MITYLLTFYSSLKPFYNLKPRKSTQQTHTRTILPTRPLYRWLLEHYTWRLEAFHNYVINIETKLFSNLKRFKRIRVT
jgi:hypothetical protein